MVSPGGVALTTPSSPPRSPQTCWDTNTTKTGERSTIWHSPGDVKFTSLPRDHRTDYRPPVSEMTEKIVDQTLKPVSPRPRVTSYETAIKLRQHWDNVDCSQTPLNPLQSPWQTPTICMNFADSFHSAGSQGGRIWRTNWARFPHRDENCFQL